MMKKSTFKLTLITLLLLCNNLHAQRITLGVKGGLSIPTISGGTSNNPLFDSNSFKIGGDFGIYGEYNLSATFSYSIGIEYSSQGGLNKFQAYPTPPDWTQYGFGASVYSNFKSEIQLNYLIIPILARQHWRINNKYNIYAGVGPFLGYLLNANRRVTSGPIYSDQKRTPPSLISPQLSNG